MRVGWNPGRFITRLEAEKAVNGIENPAELLSDAADTELKDDSGPQVKPQ